MTRNRLPENPRIADGALVQGTAAFVRASGRDRHLSLLAEGYHELCDPATGKVREDLTRPRVCPLCRCDEGRIVFYKNGFPHTVCNRCGLLYVSVVLRDEVLQNRLTRGPMAESWIDVLLTDAQRRMDTEKFQMGLDVIETLVPGRRLVDIGCSVGHFMELARARGWETEGFEVNPYAVAHARSLGLKVHQQTLTEHRYPAGSFDAATLWEVLDDLPDPGPLMQTLQKILRPGGALFVVVPNADSLAVRAMREYSATFDGATSVTFFSPRTLPPYLAQFGFVVRVMQTIISELGSLNNYLHFNDPYRSHQADVLLDMITPELLHERLMGYKLLVLAERCV
jgi:2-polyprenyl-3-methyl-5-hydroxy-6-metoxy-1,4-benzoquinol methylase